MNKRIMKKKISHEQYRIRYGYNISRYIPSNFSMYGEIPKRKYWNDPHMQGLREIGKLITRYRHIDFSKYVVRRYTTSCRDIYVVCDRNGCIISLKELTRFENETTCTNLRKYAKLMIVNSIIIEGEDWIGAFPVYPYTK